MTNSMLKGIERSEYGLFLVPFNRAQASKEIGDGVRFDCYFVRKGYPWRESLEGIFMKSGAIKIPM